MDNQEQKKHQYRPHGGQQDSKRPHPLDRNQSLKPALGSWKDKWEDTKLILQSKYAVLTDEDLNYSRGKEEEAIYRRVGKRLGKNRQETEQLFNDIYQDGLKQTNAVG